MYSIKNKNTYFRKLLITASCAMLLVSFSASASAKVSLNIQNVTMEKEEAAINNKVRAECKLLEKTKKYLLVYGKKNFSPVTTEKKAVAGVYNLSVTIVSTVGAPGGAFSGRKGVTMKGVVNKNGKLVGSFEAFRSSSSSGWGRIGGTCSILGHTVKRLGRDIAEWARSPAPNSKIGELK